MSKVSERFLDVLFTRRCRQCGEVIALDEDYCEECKALKRITGKTCPKCGREVKHCVCAKQKFSPGYKAFCAPYYYKDSVQRGVLRLKHSGHTQLVPCMAERIVQTVKERFDDVTFDAVTFIPMGRIHQFRRGFNQSELLAKEVADALGVPCEAMLKKIKITRMQHRSSAAQRKVNLYGAFDIVDAARIQGKTVLLIDDVKTTGTTLSECAVTLNMHGAKAVYAAAYAVTDAKPNSK